MDVKKVVEIDLSKYGKTGTVVVGKPTFRRMTQMKNDIGKMSKGSIGIDGTQKFTGALTGDMDIIYTMVYVRSAPFSTSVDGFLTFCDELDEIEVGNAELFWNELIDAVVEIKGTGNSPFVSSPAAETESSE